MEVKHGVNWPMGKEAWSELTNGSKELFFTDQWEWSMI